jgi:hypothetical protein
MFYMDHRERKIRKVLRKLAQQRVAIILQPGNIWVIEKAVGDGDGIDAALRTCDMRGWIELMEDAIPQGELTKEGKLPNSRLFTQRKPIYRLTGAGWDIVNNSHRWVLYVAFVGTITLLLGILEILKVMIEW